MPWPPDNRGRESLPGTSADRGKDITDMAVKIPVKTRLYTIQEAADQWHVPISILYQEIKAGRLRAKMRRGNVRGYFVTEKVMDEWIDDGLVDVYDVNFAPDTGVLS